MTPERLQAIIAHPGYRPAEDDGDFLGSDAARG